MRIKSYFVSTVDEAMAQAIAELGEDALLLRTRQTDGGYEVVFGSEDAGDRSEDAGRAPLADARGSAGAHNGTATVRERSTSGDRRAVPKLSTPSAPGSTKSGNCSLPPTARAPAFRN